MEPIRRQLSRLTFPIACSLSVVAIFTVLAIWTAAFLPPLPGGPPGSSDRWRTGPITGLRSYAYQLGRTWDSRHYTGIARGGYDALSPSRAYYAYFPLFPAEIRLVDRIAPGGTEAGAVLTGTVNYVVLAGVLFTFFGAWKRRFRSRFDPREATVFALFMPFTFFCFVPYTEGLFAALLVGAFGLVFFVRSRWLWLLPFLTFLAALTRNSGLILVPALATYVGLVLLAGSGSLGARFRRQRRLVLAAGAGAVAALLGLLTFLGYGWLRTGDFWVSRNAQGLWGRTLTGKVWEPVRANLVLAGSPARLQRACADSQACRVAVLYPLASLTLFVGSFAAALRWLGRRPEVVTLLVYSGFALVFPLLSNDTTSLNRYLAVTPLLLLLTPILLTRLPAAVRLVILIGLVVVQTALFTTYAAHYWVG